MTTPGSIRFGNRLDDVNQLKWPANGVKMPYWEFGPPAIAAPLHRGAGGGNSKLQFVPVSSRTCSLGYGIGNRKGKKGFECFLSLITYHLSPITYHLSSHSNRLHHELRRLRF